MLHALILLMLYQSLPTILWFVVFDHRYVCDATNLCVMFEALIKATFVMFCHIIM